MAKHKKKKKFRVLRLFIKLQIIFLLLVTAGVAYFYFGGYAKEVQAMKEEAAAFVKQSNEETFKTSQTGTAYAADGTIISTWKGEKDSSYVTIENMPVQAAAAIVSIEDKKFYRHNGIDYKALLRAAKAMIENGEVKQGGSTITMQLAKNIFLSQERTWQRKIEEMFIARELEEKYSKDKILEFYLNNIYFGNGYYGIQTASKGYFNRNISELSLSQIAFLCAVPNNPTLYDPLTNMENTISRRNRILKNMVEDGKISEIDYAQAITEEIVLERPPEAKKNDYVQTYTYYCAARALMELEGFEFQYEFEDKEEQSEYEEEYSALYAECQRKLYTAGYQVHTSLDLELQQQLQQSVDENLGQFTEVNEEGVYKLQASAVCIDNETGYVKAIVGGRSQEFSGYTLNRAYQSFRQPGSAIKPLIVYTPLLEKSYTADTLVVDEPIEDGPKNANGAYQGEVTLRYAVEHSINTIAWKLFDELSPVTGLSYLKEMDFSHLDKEDYRLSTALGGFTHGTSALEMASAYSALENDGIYRKPTCIVKILDSNGNEIYVSNQAGEEVYRQNAARQMSDILKGVITSGTAKGLGLGEMPSAGKTGTTNDRKDGWFVGYTRYYTTSVWVGYDLPQKMKDLKGASYPGHIWQNFMEKAHEGLAPLDFLPAAQINGEYESPYFSDTDEDEEAGSEADESMNQENTPERDGMAPGAEGANPENPQDGTTPEAGGVTPETPQEGTAPEENETNPGIPQEGNLQPPGEEIPIPEIINPPEESVTFDNPEVSQ